MTTAAGARVAENVLGEACCRGPTSSRPPRCQRNTRCVSRFGACSRPWTHRPWTRGSRSWRLVRRGQGIDLGFAQDLRGDRKIVQVSAALPPKPPVGVKLADTCSKTAAVGKSPVRGSGRVATIAEVDPRSSPTAPIPGRSWDFGYFGEVQRIKRWRPRSMNPCAPLADCRGAGLLLDLPPCLPPRPDRVTNAPCTSCSIASSGSHPRETRSRSSVGSHPARARTG